MGLKFLERDERVAYIAETLEIYKKAGIGLVQDLYKKGKRPGVLVVDLQQTFTSSESPLGTKGASIEVIQAIDGVLENTKILLEAVRNKKFPVIYIISVYREDGADGGRQVEKKPGLLQFATRGSKWVEIDKRITPQKGDYIIEKRVSSGFIGTQLLQILTYNRLDTCIVVGLSASACVRQTAVDAMSHGYYTVLPEECVGDRSIGSCKASLFELMAKYADVVSLNDVLTWVNSLT